MTDSSSYGMGQIRYSYSSSSQYMTTVACSAGNTKVAISSDSTADSGPWYNDIYIKPTNNSFTFNSDMSYLLHLEIPKNNSYDMSFLIRLVQSDSTGMLSDDLEYQKVKYITVPRQTQSSENSARVILFPVETGTYVPLEDIPDSEDYDVLVKIATDWDGTSALSVGEVGYNTSTGLYYICTTGTTYKQIYNKNVSLMDYTWVSEDNSVPDIVQFDLIFSPHTSDVDYNGIWVQVVRANYDIDIYNDNIYGRTVDEDYFSCNLYKLTNLIDGTDVPSPLSHIGVYGHPNLLMAINGQEIKVGQSGYYELNNFNITSLAIAADGYDDKFTIDYQYVIE